MFSPTNTTGRCLHRFQEPHFLRAKPVFLEYLPSFLSDGQKALPFLGEGRETYIVECLCTTPCPCQVLSEYHLARSSHESLALRVIIPIIQT